jgi:DNA-binding PadR family transcriptional regulator
MAASTSRRSPLAMMVLALLEEEPMHPYRMHELIKQRGKDAVVNVAQRNSVYQTIARLIRDGLVRVKQTAREQSRPERTVYQITPRGRATLRAWLDAMLEAPAREFPEFPAALSFVMLLAPAQARARLEARKAAVEGQLAASQAAHARALASGLPRLFLLDDEYRDAMRAAEVAWLASVVGDLKAKRLAWSAEWLSAVARQMEGAAG